MSKHEPLYLVHDADGQLVCSHQNEAGTTWDDLAKFAPYDQGLTIQMSWEDADEVLRHGPKVPLLKFFEDLAEKEERAESSSQRLRRSREERGVGTMRERMGLPIRVEA